MIGSHQRYDPAVLFHFCNRRKIHHLIVEKSFSREPGMSLAALSFQRSVVPVIRRGAINVYRTWNGNITDPAETRADKKILGGGYGPQSLFAAPATKSDFGALPTDRRSWRKR